MPAGPGVLLLAQEHRQVGRQQGEPAGVHRRGHAGGERQGERAVDHGLRPQAQRPACARAAGPPAHRTGDHLDLDRVVDEGEGGLGGHAVVGPDAAVVVDDVGEAAGAGVGRRTPPCRAPRPGRPPRSPRRSPRSRAAASTTSGASARHTVHQGAQNHRTVSCPWIDAPSNSPPPSCAAVKSSDSGTAAEFPDDESGEPESAEGDSEEDESASDGSADGELSSPPQAAAMRARRTATADRRARRGLMGHQPARREPAFLPIELLPSGHRDAAPSGSHASTRRPTT